MTTVKINGVSIDVPSGSTVNCVNGVVLIDGLPYSGNGQVTGVVKVEITGSPLNVYTDHGDIEVHGNVQGNVDAGGSVNCQNIAGNVDSGGSIHSSGDIQGSVDAGGSVNCGQVGGSIDAGGSVRTK